ncbi:SGNH/GDSL hydrolase family protein [Pedococcus ginsenosidimutans]|uniref:SGNH/GDSL hydrolase family protein n=1 Tax=Pedococcus ginsenosidimutans TaxID=490570 RepID=UPI0031EEF7C8
MRRRWTAVLGLVTSVALLAGCGQRGTDLSPAAATATRSTATTPSVPSTTAPTSTAPSTTPPATTPTTTAPSPTPTPHVVVGLGDSVTSGYACGCTDFVRLYATMLGARAGHPVRPVNLGVSGLTTTTLGTQLSAPQTTAALSQADVVVVTIGANDLSPLVSQWQHGGCGTTCMQKASRDAGAGVAAALARVRATTPAHARILVTTYWNVFEDGDVADADFGPGFAQWSDAVTRSANAAIRAAATADGDQVVDLYAPFEGDGDRNPTDLLADDGDHPNAAGHRLIARTLLAASTG